MPKEASHLIVFLIVNGNQENTNIKYRAFGTSEGAPFRRDELRRLWLAQGRWNEGAGEGAGGSSEIVGGDGRMLLFHENQGAEIEALDFGARLHMGVQDSAAERVDEGLRWGGVVGHRLGWIGLSSGRGHGRQNLRFQVEASFYSIGRAGGCVRMGLTRAGAVVVRVKISKAEKLLRVGGDVGADESLFFGECDCDG